MQITGGNTVTHKIKKMTIFFDTETNGLPKDYKGAKTDVNNWPRIVQLAFATYKDGDLVEEFDFIIKPDGWTIPTETADIHGITQEIAEEQGIPIKEALQVFLTELGKCDTLVAHNLNFDYPVVICEYLRARMSQKPHKVKKVCTMLSSIDFCDLPGPYGPKWPKLEELHRKLFGKDFEGAHNALFDIRATAACYFELHKRVLIQ